MNIRKAFLGFAGAVLAIGGFAPTAPQAQAVIAPTSTVSVTTVADDWEYVGDFYWQSDCHNAGSAGISGGAWSKYKCVDGSWFPGDDYELWVVY
jgi:hypothetical protein